MAASNPFDTFDEPAKSAGARNPFDAFDEGGDGLGERSWGAAAKDAAASVLKGVLGVARLSALAGDQLYAKRGFDNPVVRFIDEYGESVDDQKSPQLQARERAAGERAREAGRRAKESVGDGALGTAARVGAEFGSAALSAATDPALLASVAAEQIPTLGAMGAAAKGTNALAGAAARAAPQLAATRAGAAVVGNAGTAGAVAAGAGLQGADIGSDVFKRLMAMPDAAWREHPDFPDLAALVGVERAKLTIANHEAAIAGAKAGAATVVTSALPGGSAIERAVAGKGPGTWRAVPKAAAGEAAQEGLEEGAGQLYANQAVAKVDPRQDLAEGVGPAAGQGAVAGGLIGGGLHAAQAVRGPRAAPEATPPAAVPPTPASPPPSGAELRPATDSAPPAAAQMTDEARLAQLEIAAASRPLTEAEQVEVVRLGAAIDSQTPEDGSAPPAPDAPADTPLFGSPLSNPSLQNRDRRRAASVAQMAEIARQPDYARLGISRSPESGAPMVFALGDRLDAIAPDALGNSDTAVMADGQRVPFRYAVVDATQVEPSNFADGSPNAGFDSDLPGTLKALNNGRTAGVRAAHQLGTASQYLDGLRADAAAHGIPAEVISRTPNAMLVRLYGEGSNTPNMAAKSQGQALGLSPSEQARQDAGLLDSSVLAVYQPADVASPANRDFVRAFVGKARSAGLDVAPLMTEQGTLSAPGRQRVQAALMHAAYTDSDLVAEMFESVQPEVKAIGEALKSVAGEWASMRDSARQGVIGSDADVTENLLQAVGLIRKARAEQRSLHELLRQPDLMTGETPDPITVGLVRMFYGGRYLNRPHGRERVAEMLRDFIAAASATSNGEDLLGERVTVDDIVRSITAKTEETDDAQARTQEGGDFADRGPRPGSGAAQERAEVPGRSDAGAGDRAGAAGRVGEQAIGDTGGQGRTQRDPGDEAQAVAAGRTGRPGPSVAAEEARVYRVKDPASNPDVPLDLFPDTLAGLQVPGDARGLGAKRPDVAGVRGDVQPAAAVPGGVAPNVLAVRQDAALPGLYHYSTQLVEVGRRELPVAQVRTWQDAASALQAMGRFAVEHFDVLVTDAAGKPLAVVGAFKGGVAHSPVDIPGFLQEALRIQGAARAWAVHNHPSGGESLSQADEKVSRDAGRAFEPSSVQWMGLAAIGADRFEAVSPDGQRYSGVLISGKPAATVPVVERTITRGNAGMPVLDDPGKARAVVVQAAQGKPGIVFADTRGRLTAWVPVEPNEMRALRTDGRFDRLIGAAAEAGARLAFVANPGGVMPSRTLSNIASALALADVRVQDVIDPVSGESAAERGDLPSRQLTVLSRTSGRARTEGGIGLAAAAEVVGRIQRKLPGLPRVHVMSSPERLAGEGSQGRLRQALQQRGAMRDAEGALHEGEIYLFADHLASARRAEHVLAEHEVGHYGLRAIFGDELPKQLRSLFNQNPAVRRRVAALMEQEPGLSTLEAIEEALVDMPSADLARLTGWRALVGRVVKWLGEHGFERTAADLANWLRGTLTEQEQADLYAANLVRAAREVVTRPRDAAEPLSATSRAVFSRRPREGETVDGKPVPPPATPNPWQRAKAAAMRLTDPKVMDRLIYEVQDKFVDLKRVQQHIADLGGTVNDLNDSYTGEELYHKRLAFRTERFLEDELRPLLAEMRSRGVTIEAFERYLHARHAPEANAALAERNPSAAKLDALREDARKQVKALEQRLVHARAARSATKALEEALQLARAEAQRLAMAQAFSGPEAERRALSGMSDEEAARVMAELTPEQQEDMQALAVRVDEINAGTLKALQDYGLMSREALDAWRSRYQHYVPLHRDEAHADSATHPIGTGFSVKGNASRSRVGSTAEVTHILGNIAMQREAALTRGEKNLVAKQLYLLAAQNPDPDWWSTQTLPMTKTLDPVSGFVRVGVDPRYKSMPNVVMVRIAGKDVAITFNEHNPRAMRLAEAMKNLDVGDLHVVLGLAAKGTRWFASINTQYNPIFGLVNWARDLQAGLLNLSTTPLAGKQREVAAGVFPAMRAIYRTARGKTATDAEWSRLWQEMQEAGGTTGYRDLFADAADRAKAIEKELKALDRGQASKAAHAIVDWLSDYNETMENSVRLAAYRVALDAGMSKVRAASLALNLTVAFTRKGRQMREIGALWAYANASVQGTARMFETLRGPVGKRIMFGGVALGALNTLLGMAVMGGGEDDPWEQIPEFIKERSLVIPLGREDYVALPMPLGFHVFPNIGRVAVEMALGPQDKSLGRRLGSLLMVFADAFNPLGGAQDLGQLAAPTVIDPIVALMENRDWTGRPIYRENPNGLDPKPGHAMARDSASTPARALAKAINMITGGTEYRPGAWSPTPDQIDYVVGQLTGGLGREVLKANQTIASQFTGDELPPHKVPLIGRLYGNTRGTSGHSGRFYDNVKALNELENEIKGRERAGRDTEEVFRSEPLAELVGVGNTAEARVRALRAERRAVAELAEPGYRDELREIDASIGEAMRELNQQVAEARRRLAAAR